MLTYILRRLGLAAITVVAITFVTFGILHLPPVDFVTAYGDVAALRDVSFSMRKGEVLGIVGESGSGKTVACRAILKLIAANARVKSGRILFEGRDVLAMDEKALGHLRGEQAAMIFQNPSTHMDPLMPVGRQVGAQVQRIHCAAASRRKGDRMDGTASHQEAYHGGVEGVATWIVRQNRRGGGRASSSNVQRQSRPRGGQRPGDSTAGPPTPTPTHTHTPHLPDTNIHTNIHTNTNTHPT